MKPEWTDKPNRERQGSLGPQTKEPETGGLEIEDLEIEELDKDEPDKRPQKSAAGPSRRPKKKQRPNLHLILLCLMAAALLFALIRFLLWNRGTHSGFDRDNISTEFDTEPLDYIQPLDPSLLEGREDDGVHTILALGNDPFSDDRGPEGLAEQIAQKLDAVVRNGAFPGSTIATKNPEYESSYPLDGLSLYWTVAALANQNFQLMDAVAGDLEAESAAEASRTLQDTDMELVDTVLIFYDLQDYRGKRIVYDAGNENNINTVYGALNASVQLIQKTWPHIRIVVLSPFYGTYTDGDGTLVDGDRDDLGNGTLTDYLNWMVQACSLNGVSILDNYYGTITVGDTDCLQDGFHLNQKGRERTAGRVAALFSQPE